MNLTVSHTFLTVQSPDQPGVELVLLPPPNPDTTFEALRAGGAEVMQEPIDQPYGVRDCAFRDPFGNQLRFSEPQG